MNEAVSVEQGGNSFFGNKLTRRQKMTRRILVLLGAAGLIAAATTFVPREGQTAGEAAAEPTAVIARLPVPTIIAKPEQAYARSRTYTGVLKESRRSQLSFQRGGELLELAVDEGDLVDEGQTLGRLDARHIRARRAQVEAQVSQAQAVLDELVAGPRKETIAAKRAELRAQQSQREVLASQVDRRKKLLESEAVSEEEYETYQFDLQAAIAREDVVQKQLDELLAGTRTEQIAAQRARLADLDAQLTDLANDLEDTRLVAPYAGRVAQRFVDEGNVISAGVPVLELIDDANVEAWIGLPPAVTGSLNVGDSYELSVDRQTVEAEIQSLAPDVQQNTRTRNVILRLNSKEREVLPGQVVRLAITEQVSQPGYWVPTTALTQGRRGLWSLFVVEDDVVVRKDVELLDTVGTESFVRGTVQPGDQIVASGTHRVVVGQQVTTQVTKVAQR